MNWSRVVRKMTPDEALETALDEVDYLVDELELPDEVNQIAGVIVRRWADLNRLQSRPVRVNAAAAVAVGCANANVPYTTRDVAAKMRDDSKSNYVSRAKNDMISELGGQLGLELSVNVPSDFIDRYCDELELPEEVEEIAREVLDMAQDGDQNVFTGRSPSGGAGAAIWTASALAGHRVSQEAVSDVSEVTTVTIRDIADSIMVAIFQTGEDIESLSRTETLDGRLSQRIEQSRERMEA